MILNVYSIFDQAANAFIQPFFLQTDGLAIRAFSGNVNSKEPNNISENPEQFTLIKIATFDDSTGHMTPLEQHETIAKALTLQEKETIKYQTLQQCSKK